VSYLDDLNEAQRKAVECTDGPMMIIAGAGSGKTRVLTYRIAYLMEKGVDPFRILALTFTNKAAREMKDRIGTIVGPEAGNLWMGTFHSVFARILRVEAGKIGYPSNFTIYDTDDSKSLNTDIIKGQGLDDKTYKPSTVLARISSAKNSLVSADEYNNDTQAQSDDRSYGRPMMGQLYSIYVNRCRKANAMDFDDLLFNTYLLLKNFPDVLHKYQHKFNHVLVDEFQDTNFAQYAIIKKFGAAHENVCVVGDDAQSIYAFRGANIQNILSFEKDYPDLKTFRLEQNYRSTKIIVNAANGVIANNRHQLKKEVWTHNDDGDKIRLIKAHSDNEEGYSVAHAIFQDKMNCRWLNKDFAILYRTNAQSRSFEEALRKLNIPYRIYGGLSFYKRKEIKDLLAYFHLTLNPRDDEALKRIINYPARGIGKTTLEKLVVVADSLGKSIWEIIESPDATAHELGGAVRTKLNEFLTRIKSYAVMARTHNAYETASHIATSSGILKELYDDKTPEGLSRYENIQELLNGIKEFCEKAEEKLKSTELKPDGTGLVDENTGEVFELPSSSLQSFMQDVALLTDADDEDEDNDKVSLMTIHASKGLEFKEVFVVGLEENLFPSQLSLQSRTDLEEERRLFYVAITRAEKKLSLSFALSRYRWGNLVYSEPSRFLEEVNPQYLEAALPQVPSGGSMIPEEEREHLYSYRTKPARQKSPSASVTKNFRPLKADERSVQTEANFEADDANTIQPGMEVEHQKFGLGKVLNLEGAFPNAKATIFFHGFGQKQILLKFAKLKIRK
jgi:DNA helicase-2/ATP-dependent DNA helicase PcrA